MSLSRCEKFRNQIHPKITVGLIHLERQRPWPKCTNPETGNQWCQDMHDAILDVLGRTGFEIVHVQLESGQKINSDKTLRRAIGYDLSNKIDVLVAIQPVISDGRLAPILAQEWRHPLIFFATPEEQTGMMISGNSLVGSHLMCASLNQLGFKSDIVYGNLDWLRAEKKLIEKVNWAFANRYIRHCKIGLIGYQAPGFIDFHPNPFVLTKTFGSILAHYGITEYVNCARNFEDQVVEADVKHVTTTLGLKWKDPTDQMDIGPSSRHYLAMKKFIEDENLDALAVRCWPELPGIQDDGGLDQWCYMALARLASEGFPIACEGDVDGAFGCLVGKLLGCGTIYLSDWLEHDKNSLTLWHGGMAPFQLSEAIGTPLGPCIGRHFNNCKPGVVDATIKIGLSVTVFRFWVMNDKYHLIVLEGETIAPKRHLLGNNGLVRFSDKVDLLEAFDEWILQGFPHHVCVVEGHHGRKIIQLGLSYNVNIVSQVIA